MEYIGKALEIFLEKQLIPTIISVVIMFMIIIVLPDNFWMINKIRLMSFRILVFGLSFILINLIVWMHECHLKKNKIKEYEERNRKEDLEKREKQIKSFRELAD